MVLLAKLTLGFTIGAITALANTQPCIPDPTDIDYGNSVDAHVLTIVPQTRPPEAFAVPMWAPPVSWDMLRLKRSLSATASSPAYTIQPMKPKKRPPDVDTQRAWYVDDRWLPEGQGRLSTMIVGKGGRPIKPNEALAASTLFTFNVQVQGARCSIRPGERTVPRQFRSKRVMTW